MSAQEIDLIIVIDDDEAFRRSLVFLLEDLAWRVLAFDSATAFLEAFPKPAKHIGCILLDIRMPAMSGMALQVKLKKLGWTTPIIFLTGHGDLDMAVQAMKLGAFGFIAKPFKDQTLLDEVAAAVRLTQHRAAALEQQRHAKALLDTLSPRESEVALLLARGLANRQVGQTLGISEKTVHIHRHNIMNKVGISSVAELVYLMLKADPHHLD